jgi:two-component system CheB/CheR fusion protein
LKVLLAELQHRVRNTLAVVKSIARRTAQSTDTADEMADHLAGRLDAFARVQSAVARNPNVGIDLASLLADEMLAHAVHEGDTLVMKGPTVLLKARAAESISLAIHELTTNAVKHGALRDKDGKIAVKWRVSGSDGEKRLVFEWTEQAPNNHVSHGPRDGFGMELLAQILPHDLGAKTDLDFRAHGVRFNLELPYEHLVTKDGGGTAA